MSGPSGEVKPNMEFPEIISFLVVDGDTANSKFIRDALQFLGCKVKACKYKEQALSLLREQKPGFDIVVADINIPYEMGFKFVEIVSSKINIPIIMMCSTSNNEVITAGMNFGACEVAVKPVGIDDVMRFWQYAVTHRRQSLLGVGNSASNSQGLQGQDKGSNQGRIHGQLYKNRLVWTEDLKALFVATVHALGGKDVAVPKRIMDRMNVPYLTRQNIASHLQKYRLYSDPNYLGGKRKRKDAQRMVVNRMDEQAPVVAHPNRCLLSFEAPEFGPNAQNVSTQQLFSQTEGTSKRSRGIHSDSMQVNKIAGYGNQYFEEPKIAQFPIMPEHDTFQQLCGSTNVQPYVPEPLAEPMMMQGMAMPEVFGDSHGPSLPAQSSLELQVPSDGIRSEETPGSPDPELESFLAMDLSDPNFPFFDEYPPQDMSMIYGGLSDGLHDNSYPVVQSEMGNGDLSALNNKFGNDPSTDSLVKGDVKANNPVTMHSPQNSAMGGMQERKQGTINGYVWFGPKPPGTT